MPIFKKKTDTTTEAIRVASFEILNQLKTLERLLGTLNGRLGEVATSLIGIKAEELETQKEIQKFFKVERQIREREGNTVIEPPTPADMKF